MMKRVFTVLIFSSLIGQMYAQDAPNLNNASQLSPTTAAASKLSSVPVNLYTGVPQIGVPIYSYNNQKGLSLNISFSYDAGGAQLGESPTITGLGWFLNAGGAITRTVRGMPDDLPTNGYMYAAAIPSDYRSNGNKYYYDSLDAAQDVFQFSFNGRSGKFFIGKNGQIALIPQSKLKVQYGTSASKITWFKITTEEGVKYIFADLENTVVTQDGPDSTLFKSGYTGVNYTSAWYLSQIISPYYTDTIQFSYATISNAKTGFPYPQVGFFRTSDNVMTEKYAPKGTNTSDIRKISSIVFPENQRVDFIYNPEHVYNAADHSLTKIKISDTVFRSGYVFGYQNNGRLLLTSITPYTSKEFGSGYTFSYDTPNLPSFTSADSMFNKKDHWGFYNGASNGSNLLPTVGAIAGADRNPNLSYADANSLKYMYLPGGGYIYYQYELNDHLPYTKSNPSITINTNYNTTNTLTLTDVLSSMRQINFNLSSSVNRSANASAILNGTCTFNCSIVNAANTSIVYATYSFSLYDLFYNGIRTWTFTVPDGTYKLLTTLTGGGSPEVSFPIVVGWENKLTDNSVNAVTAGGLRIKRITRKNSVDDVDNPVITDYKYVREDGKSSGFLGDIPKYDYAYQETLNGTTTNYTAISSEPLNTLNYTQGSPVGYSRVEVINGTTNNNIGKEVYEFTDLKDAGTNFCTSVFPYAPQDLRDWGLGLPKAVSIYDNAETLIKKTINKYAFTTTGYTNSNFKSIKLGCSLTTTSGGQKTKTFVALEYYPSSGYANLDTTIETTYHDDGSVQADTVNYDYDATYFTNVSKVATSYDRTRGLKLETRLYYPFNYTFSGNPVSTMRDSGIITPVISTEKWITGDANPRIVDGNITTFLKMAQGYIVPQNVYKFQNNAPVNQSVIGNFDPTVLNRNFTYFVQQGSFVTYYGNGVAAQTNNTVTGINSSIILDYNLQYAVAKVANAAYGDISFTSFESDGSTGTWTIASTARDYTSALTGKRSYNLTNGSVSKSGLSSSKTYLVTVWAKSGAAVSVNSSSFGSAIATQNGWSLYSKELGGITAVTITGSGLIDELRLHPKDANMVSYTYEPMVGVTSTNDANNTITYTEYDNLNRIKLIRDKDKNILKKYDYTDNPKPLSILPNWVGTRQCENGIDGKYDSVYTDENFYSDTYKQKNVIFKGYDYCGCTQSGAYPRYKLVNGVCEYGLRYNTASSYVKITQGDSSYWVWRCTYHYEWSDGSRMPASPANYTEDCAACTQGCPLGLDDR